MENKKWHLDLKIKRTIEALGKNNMEAFYVDTLSDLHKMIKEIVPEKSVVSVGGSRTLFETGIMDLLRDGTYEFLDRYKEGLTPSDIKQLYRDSFSADAYFTSTNALTESGELYNVDGTGNRVASMIYGPDTVIVICGINKIVKNLDEAIDRNRRIAAPINAKRLNRNTPCAVTGLCSDCNSPDRICNDYVVIRRQGLKDRIKVIIVGNEYGY